jgi:hypothetical protein
MSKSDPYYYPGRTAHKRAAKEANAWAEKLRATRERDAANPPLSAPVTINPTKDSKHDSNDGR